MKGWNSHKKERLNYHKYIHFLIHAFLNYDQQQFTYNILNEKYNLGEISQVFSDGITIPNLKIGDS